MKRPAGAPSKETPSAKQLRAQELARCAAEMQQVLERYDASTVVTQSMQLGADGTPRYTFRIDVIARPTS